MKPTASASRSVCVSTKIARPPLARISSATARPRSASMSAMATCAPSSAKRRAVASPIPEAPPVTAATLPSSRAMRAPRLSAPARRASRPAPRAAPTGRPASFISNSGAWCGAGRAGRRADADPEVAARALAQEEAHVVAGHDQRAPRSPPRRPPRRPRTPARSSRLRRVIDHRRARAPVEAHASPRRGRPARCRRRRRRAARRAARAPPTSKARIVPRMIARVRDDVALGARDDLPHREHRGLLGRDLARDQGSACRAGCWRRR